MAPDQEQEGAGRPVGGGAQPRAREVRRDDPPQERLRDSGLGGRHGLHRDAHGGPEPRILQAVSKVDTFAGVRRGEARCDCD